MGVGWGKTTSTKALKPRPRDNTFTAMTNALDNAVRVTLYSDFIATGSCPPATRIAELIAVGLAEVHDALERLAAGKAIVLQPQSREVLMAPPLSAVPTGFVVQSNSRSFFANCIWDALGVLAMVNPSAVIETSCACCGEAIQLTVKTRVESSIPAIIHFAIPARHWWDNIVFT